MTNGQRSLSAVETTWDQFLLLLLRLPAYLLALVHRASCTTTDPLPAAFAPQSVPLRDEQPSPIAAPVESTTDPLLLSSSLTTEAVVQCQHKSTFQAPQLWISPRPSQLPNRHHSQVQKLITTLTLAQQTAAHSATLELRASCTATCVFICSCLETYS